MVVVGVVAEQVRQGLEGGPQADQAAVELLGGLGVEVEQAEQAGVEGGGIGLASAGDLVDQMAGLHNAAQSHQLLLGRGWLGHAALAAFRGCWMMPPPRQTSPS